MTLVDTNVLIDILVGDPKWSEWSIVNLRDRAPFGPTIANDIVYAELCAGASDRTMLDATLEALQVTVERMPRLALWLAGRTFNEYRRAGGQRTSLLSDFLIGAHAQIEGLALLTRDARRYRTYFPDVALITPDA